MQEKDFFYPVFMEICVEKLCEEVNVRYVRVGKWRAYELLFVC